jgi:hypothetical protein
MYLVTIGQRQKRPYFLPEPSSILAVATQPAEALHLKPSRLQMEPGMAFLTHISGPWTSPGVEKRANAFAAMFLMPRSLLHRAFMHSKIDENNIVTAAGSMKVGLSALVEHLYNTSMIDEFERDRFRTLTGTTQQ